MLVFTCKVRCRYGRKRATSRQSVAFFRSAKIWQNFESKARDSVGAVVVQWELNNPAPPVVDGCILRRIRLRRVRVGRPGTTGLQRRISWFFLSPKKRCLIAAWWMLGEKCSTKFDGSTLLEKMAPALGRKPRSAQEIYRGRQNRQNRPHGVPERCSSSFVDSFSVENAQRKIFQSFSSCRERTLMCASHQFL